MFKLFALVFVAILAVAAASPGVVSSYAAPVVSAYGYSPLAYSAGYGYPGYGYGYGHHGYSAYPYAYQHYY